jgi:pyruvate/2-oxoglutarate dehydrogenase complex dihydrolipoamide dehydrogenase (E3) component
MTVLQTCPLLVAAGRSPNTEGLGLDLGGVELTDHGYIKVNERLQTTAPGVWAIGEVAGSPQFTHISVDDFRVVHDNLSGMHHVTTGRHVPYCLFTDAELARIGLNENFYLLKQNLGKAAATRNMVAERKAVMG